MTEKPITRKRAKARSEHEMSPLERVQNTVFKCGIINGLHIQVKTLTRKKVTAEMRIKPIHLNHNGWVNGGALMAFADIVGSVGAGLNRPAGYSGGTIESKTNFFVPGQAPVTRAVSIPLHIGRTTSVWQTTLSNADGRVIAVVTQTQIALPPRPAAG